MILYLSDFDLVGSGYMQISIALCKAMADRGYKITALGMGYDGSEHNWPFSIIPIQHGDSLTVASAMMQNFAMLAKGRAVEPIEALIVALDIPIQERMMMTVRKFADWPYIGIFPIESGPLCPSWAAILNNMTSRLVISQYGLQQMADAGVGGQFLPVGLDTASWRPPQPEERKALRESMGFTDDMMVVLTVADNQERKNLWAAAETIKLMMEDGMDPQWTLVTRVHSPVGWRMADLGWKLGIQEHVMPFERGLPFDRLWTLYAIADAFLLTSKAEGFGMPMIEAMACGVPVVATDCTAIPEQIFEDYPGREVPRGFPIAVDYWNLDPWGNSMRAWASPASAAAHLRTIYEWKKSGDTRLTDIVNRGIAYARARTWDNTAAVLLNAVEEVKLRPAIEETPVVDGVPMPANIQPLTVPRPLPVLGVGGRK